MGAVDRPARHSLGPWLRYAARRFRAASLSFGHGTANARDEAAWLVCHVSGVAHGDLNASLERFLSVRERRRLFSLIDRRIDERVPMAYLLKEAWLGEHRFYVDERVIVPRSHIAELLRDGLSPWVPRSHRVRTALDLCTGSGCLAIVLALAFPRAEVHASDLSSGALTVAKRNIRAYGLERRVRLLRSDLFRDLPHEHYDLIVANPPYVDAATMASLPTEYRREPRRALAGGQDGLHFVRRIVEAAPAFLARKGRLIIEVGRGMRRLERAFPALPLTWLDTSAGSGLVFLLTREQLQESGVADGIRTRNNRNHNPGLYR